MSLLSTSHTHSFKRTKSTLYTIILSLCFVFANSAFASSNPSSSISQNTEVYLVTTDWIDSNSSLIFNPVSEEYFLSKTESSNSSLVFSQPFPNPDSDGDGIEDAIDLDDDNDGILDSDESNYTNTTNIQTDNTWKKSTVENATEGSSFNGVSFGDIPNSATFTENVTIGNPANGTITGVDKIVAPLSKQTYYRKTFTLTNTTGFKEAIIKASRDNSCQIFINGNDVARTNATPSVGAIFGLKINESGANQNGYNHTAFATFTSDNANDIFVDGENEIIFVLDDFGGSAGLSLDLDLTFYELTDTDGDGTPNGLDLDSDGDGCSDALEAGATTNTTANYAFTGAVGANGLVDTLETSVDSGVINYTSTYNPYAVSDFLAGCVDTDSDEVNDLLDIDDDNDGILDATESPSCFYLANEITSNMSVSTTIATYNTTSWGIQNTIDNNTGTRVQYNRITSIVGEEVFKLEFITPIKLTSFELDMSDYPISGVSGTHVNTTMLQGSLDGTNWFDLQTAATSLTTTNGIETIQNTEQPNTAYQYYRLLGVTGRPDHGRIKEITPILNNFNTSLYPKDNCSVDTDGDGTYNHLDLDSDGDGCNDSIEGVSPIPASPWSPAEITTSVWLDAADASTINADGNGVSQWDDKSGNDHHAVQTNNSYKPAHVQNDLAGKDGVDFYQNKSLRKNTGTQTVGYVIAVLKAENATWNNYHAIFGHRANSRFGGFMQSGNTGFHNNVYPGSVWVDGTSKTVSQSGFSTIDSPHIWSYTPNGNSVKTLTAGYNMGSYDNNNGNGSATHYEVVVLPTIPTDEERQILEGYLAHKWDLAANLPDGHPYKNAAPESSNLVGGGSGATCNIFTKPSNNSTSVYNTGDDTNNNGLLDAFEGAEAGTTNYTSRYVAYALDNSINACTDSDGDDVGDIFDLDDDNDGVLDTTEGTGDTDNDGTPNHLDTDSDNDGCLDTIEAGTTNNGATTDANCNGLLDQYQDGVTNTINYTSTYNSYALNNTINSCVDTDSDGVNDVFDIDDDNDGILDTVEDNLVSSLTAVAGASAITIDSNNFTVNNISGGWGAGSVHSNDLGIAPNEDFTLSLEVELFSQRHIMIGLNASGNNSTNSYSDIDYALYFGGNSVTIYENGSNKGTLSSVTADSDVFSIERVGTTITYSKNGTVFYTSLTASSAADYYIDSSMQDNGNNGYTISNILVTTPSSDLDGDGLPNSRDLDSDGDGCPDALEGAGAFTSSQLVVDSSMDGGNTDNDGAYTGESTSPVQDNLGTPVNLDGIPAVASEGQGVGTSQTANPVLDASEHINLAVSDVSYSSLAADAVFTITDAVANFTYELVDANGDPLNPQVLATQGSSTGDLDLTILAANVPTGATNTTFEVVAGVSNACTVTLDDKPELTLVDTDDDGVNDVSDLDDDNDGILDIDEFTPTSSLLWLDASDETTITKDSNGLVSQWNDKSGNGHHATQSTTDNQPNTTAGTITFDGNDKLELPHGVIPDPTESSMVFMVGLSGAQTSPYNGFLSNGRAATSQSYSIRTSGSNMYWYAFNNDLTIPLTTPYTNLSIYGIDLNTASNTVKAYQNGELKATKNSFTGVNNTGTELGSIGVTPGSSGTNNEFLVGEIREIIVVKSQPSLADRQKIEGYLAHKWGLAASLPADHPYKNATPSSDLDGDGLPNSRDLDSDGDGIPDNIEAQTTAGYTVPGNTIDNITGINTTYGSGLTPIDTDADGTPDFLDIDSDNDQTNDNTEAKLGGLTLSNLDADNDGLDDAIDADVNNFGPVNANIEDVLDEYEDTTALNDASLVDVLWRVDCEFGKISTEQYVISATGNHSGSWGTDNGVIGAPDETGSGTTANRISLHRNLVTLTYQDIFSDGAVITMYARHWSGSYTGGFTMAFSEDNSTWTSESSSQNIGSASYTTLNYTVPNNLNGNYKYIRLTYDNVGGNTLTLIDAVKVAYEVCNDCPTGVDAPALSTTTITNDCTDTVNPQTMDLTSITASNLPANTTLTWHTGVPATDANKVSAPATAVAGIYYASFYSEAGSCYTREGEAVTAVTADGDSDCDNVPNAIDIDDDNDGVLDTEESNNFNVEEISETLPIGTLSGSTGLIRSVVGSVDIMDGTLHGVSTTPFMGTNYISFHTTGSGARSESFSIQLSEPLIAGELLNISFQAITLDDGVRAWDNSSKIHIDGGNSFGDDSVNLYITPSTGNNSEGWKNYSFNYVATSSISHITIYNVSDTNAESFVGIDNMMILAIVDTDGDDIPNSLDLDSDGDGCSDALEAGATTDKTADYAFTGDVGANGLVDTLETSTESGTINYTSTYSAYAINDAINACTDTDDDGVNDVSDLDDDNDGILDIDEFTPTSSSLLWLDASDETTITKDSDGLVSLWNDKSGNGHHATQSTPSNQPTFDTDHINGGSSDWLNLPSDIYAGKTEGTLIIVGEQKGTHAGWGSYGSSSDNHTTHSNLHFYESFLATSRPHIGIASESLMNKQVIYSTINDGSTLKVRLDGEDISHNPANGITFDDTPTYHELFKNYANYTLYEVIFLEDDSSIQEVEGYLAHKWGLAASLPADHPYKNATPTSDLDGDGLPNSRDLDSDGDGCPDALEGAGALTSSNLETSSIDGGNTGGSYTGESTNPVQDNLGTMVVDINGVPIVASEGQGIGTSLTPNPVLDASEHINLAVSDVIYTNAAANAVFTITDAVANFTYELVDANGDPLNPQVLATQGSSTGDLDLTILAANVPTGATNTTFEVVAGVSNACKVTLDDKPELTLPDHDGDGVVDVVDLDDDNDGILDTVEQESTNTNITLNSDGTYVVPTGVTLLDVVIQGGRGGNGGEDVVAGTVQGGLGTAIGGVIEVEPGTTIEFFIGGDGVNGNTSTQSYTSQGGTNSLGVDLYNGGRGGQGGPGGYSGDGGGGGAATVMRVPQADGSYIDYVAAGGGGGGGEGHTTTYAGGLCDDVSNGSGNGQNHPSDGGGGGAGGGGVLRGLGGNYVTGDSSAFGGCNGSSYFPSGTTVTPLTGTKVSLTIVNTDNDNDGIPNRLDLDSDGDGCPDALEGAGAFTSSQLVVDSSMDGGNTDNGGAYTGESTSPVQDNLGTNVDINGVPIVASEEGQGIGTSLTPNPVLDASEHINLAVSDVSYSSSAADAVFTITDAVANFTYELVDADGNPLTPQVLATQGSSTGDLDLTILAANVPTGATTTTFEVVAGVSNACRVTLDDKPELTLVDTDGDGVGDITDLDDDNDGILDIVETDSTPADMTWHGPAQSNISNIDNGEGLSISGAQWSVAYSDQLWSLPMEVTGTISGAGDGMLGVFPENGTEGTGNTWYATSYQFQLAANGMYIRHLGQEYGWVGPNINNTTFRLVIDTNGNMEYWHNGTKVETSFATTVPTDTRYKIVLTRGSFQIANFKVLSSNPEDIDNDGLPNSRDLDSDGDGCPDALEGAGALTSSNLETSSIDGGNTGGSYTGESTSPVQDNLGTNVDINGVPIVASEGGQGIGTSLTPNPVLDASEHINLAVSDVSYSSSAADAVFTITDAVANFTYELVDADGNPLTPQVLATQGSSTGDLDLTILAANVPTGATTTTFEVVAGVSNACRVTLDDKPELTLVDTDGDGVGDITDLDDDNDGILDTIEDNLVSSLTAVAGATAITIDSNNFTVNNISGGWGAGSVHSNDLGIAPNEDFTLSLEVELFSQRYIMIGLNASGNNSTNSHSDIDYALYFHANSVIIWENGSNKGTQSSVTADSDVFSIERVGTTITYSKNGTVFYTSLTASSAADYYIDSSMHDNGNNGYTISNIWVTTGSSFDTDLDGLTNSRDLDSDGDGCPDAVEGDGVFTKLLVDSSIDGGNTGSSYTGVNYGVIQNLGNDVDSNGVPTVASGGQGVGSALDSGSSCIIAWDGSENNEWSEPANWSTNATPGSNAIVTIPSGLDTYPTATGPVTVNSVIMNNGSSLIAEDTFDGFINFNKTLVENEWFNIASPVVGQDMDEFARTQGLKVGEETGNYALGKYDNNIGYPNWAYLHSATTGTGLPFISGEGRAVNVATNRDVTFTGTMPTEDVSIAITEGAYNGVLNYYNLIGNPYPSYIPSIDILTENDIKLQQLTLWFWDHTSNGGEYVTKNFVNGMLIAPGQGFFIQRMPGSEAVTFDFTEAMQTHSPTDTFLRTNSNNPEIKVTMSNGTNTKDTEIYYIEGATTGWDNGYDSTIYNPSDAFELFSYLVSDDQGEDGLAIQSLPPSNYEAMIIPLGVNVNTQNLGTLEISATSLNLPAGINVYLEDKEDNTFTLLDDTSSFSTTLSGSENGEGRFYLHTRTESSLSAPNDFEINNISMYTTSEENLRIKGVQSGKASVVIYDILGKQILSTSFEGTGVNDILLSKHISEGVYIVRMKTTSGIINKKINLK